MKISLVGPGLIFIPPPGWGAIESLIWDYNVELSKLGHRVQIINTRDQEEILSEINKFNPDFAHVHYDCYVDILSKIKTRRKAATSHFAYIEQKEKHGEYQKTFNNFVNGDFTIFCLSESIKRTYREAGVSENRLKVLRNGAKEDAFKFNNSALFPDKSIYLARICDRKRQYLFQNIPNLHFVGNINDKNFNRNNPNYIGHWNKESLYQNLTNYANLVLLADGEADPLVTKEGLMAGLGLVVSESSTANLDLTKPFIDVIPESKINDLKYVEEIIRKNREKSVQMRNDIRKYAIEKFSWRVVAEEYVNLINSI